MIWRYSSSATVACSCDIAMDPIGRALSTVRPWPCRSRRRSSRSSRARARSCPRATDWRYEPKWDGFRTIVFRDGDDVHLQSRNGRPMNRYFPEVEEQVLALPGRAAGARRRDGRRGGRRPGVRPALAADPPGRVAGGAAGAARRRPRWWRSTCWPRATSCCSSSPTTSAASGWRPWWRTRCSSRPVTADRDDAGQWLTGLSEGVVAKEGERALPARRAHRHGQDQARAHGRRGGGRVPLRQGGGHGRLAHPRPLRRRRRAARGRPHLRLQGEARSASCSSCSSPTAPTSAAPASRAAGSPTRSSCGRACAPSSSARSRSTTSPGNGSVTGPSSCAGAPIRIRVSATSRSFAARARRARRAAGPAASRRPRGGAGGHQLPDPARQPVRGPRRRPRPRSSPTGCATRTASPSTARTATC